MNQETLLIIGAAPIVIIAALFIVAVFAGAILNIIYGARDGKIGDVFTGVLTLAIYWGVGFFIYYLIQIG